MFLKKMLVPKKNYSRYEKKFRDKIVHLKKIEHVVFVLIVKKILKNE